MSVPVCNVVWLAALAYASIENCRADWCAGNGELADVTAEVEVPSVGVPEMVGLPLLLKRIAGWTQDVGSVDSSLVWMGGTTEVNLLLSSCQLLVRPLKLLRSIPNFCRVILRLWTFLLKPSLISWMNRQRARGLMQSRQRRGSMPTR